VLLVPVVLVLVLFDPVSESLEAVSGSLEAVSEVSVSLELLECSFSPSLD
jgi:hypothetical protein